MDKLWKYIHKIVPSVDSEDAASKWLSKKINKKDVPFFMKMDDVLRMAALAGDKEAVAIMLTHITCSGFLMCELFEKEKFDIAHQIIETGRLWGSALVLFDRDAKLPIQYPNSRKYLEWLKANGYEHAHLIHRIV